VIVASKTPVSGHHIGRWLRRVRLSSGEGPDWSEDRSLVFSHPDGALLGLRLIFGSASYLYPALKAQRETDPLLRAFDGPPGKHIREK
jgi:hypothetical protein